MAIPGTGSGNLPTLSRHPGPKCRCLHPTPMLREETEIHVINYSPAIPYCTTPW